MKRFFLVLILLFIGTITACGNEVKVLEQNQINKQKYVQNYINELQKNKNDYRGYKVFEISKGKSTVVISSGEEGKKLKLGEVETSSVDTSIKIEEAKEKASEKNSYIIVEIEKIEGAFYVYDKNGEEYEGTGYYGK